MNAFIPRDVGAADKLALARLDDDGAPPAVTWPQINDGQDHPAIRRGRTGRVASSQAETAAAASGAEAEQTPAVLGVG